MRLLGATDGTCSPSAASCISSVRSHREEVSRVLKAQRDDEEERQFRRISAKEAQRVRVRDDRRACHDLQADALQQLEEEWLDDEAASRAQQRQDHDGCVRRRLQAEDHHRVAVAHRNHLCRQQAMERAKEEAVLQQAMDTVSQQHDGKRMHSAERRQQREADWQASEERRAERERQQQQRSEELRQRQEEGMAAAERKAAQETAERLLRERRLLAVQRNERLKAQERVRAESTRRLQEVDKGFEQAEAMQRVYESAEATKAQSRRDEQHRLCAQQAKNSRRFKDLRGAEALLEAQLVESSEAAARRVQVGKEESRRVQQGARLEALRHTLDQSERWRQRNAAVQQHHERRKEAHSKLLAYFKARTTAFDEMVAARMPLLAGYKLQAQKLFDAALRSAARQAVVQEVKQWVAAVPPASEPPASSSHTHTQSSASVMTLRERRRALRRQVEETRRRDLQGFREQNETLLHQWRAERDAAQEQLREQVERVQQETKPHAATRTKSPPRKDSELLPLYPLKHCPPAKQTIFLRREKHQQRQDALCSRSQRVAREVHAATECQRRLRQSEARVAADQLAHRLVERELHRRQHVSNKALCDASVRAQRDSAKVPHGSTRTKLSSHLNVPWWEVRTVKQASPYLIASSEDSDILSETDAVSSVSSKPDPQSRQFLVGLDRELQRADRQQTRLRRSIMA